MPNSYLFAYGSLINRASAAQVLGRQLSKGELIRAELDDHRLAWSSRQRVYSSALGREINAVFLNLEVAAACCVRGVLLSVSDEELARVAIREKGYQRFDVTAAVRTEGGVSPTTRIYTFIDPRHPEALADCFFLDSYLAKVRYGCEEIGEDLLRYFDETTEIPELPHISGQYSFVDAAQQSLT